MSFSKPRHVSKTSDDIPLKMRDKLSIGRIIGICLSLMAYQMAYNINFSLTNPIMGRLNICPVIRPIVWWAAPIADLVQPVIAFYSDQCSSKFGRRRPFIVAGGIGVVIGMLLMFYCEKLSCLLWCGGSNALAQVIFIFAFTLNNVFLNILQSPARSLVGDVVPDSQQVLANTIGSIMYGCGAIIPNLLGGFSVAQLIGVSTDSLVFVCGMVIVAICIIISLFCGTEVQYTGAKSDTNVFVNIYHSFRFAPPPVYRIATCFGFAWAAYFMFLVEVTDFFGTNVYGGVASDPDRYALYEQGVNFGMLTVACVYVVGNIYGTMQTNILKKIGIRLCFAISQIIETVIFIVIYFVPIHEKWIFFGLFSLLGISFTVFNSIPFAVVALSVPPEDMGKNMAIINTFGCIGQQTSNLVIGSGVGTLWPDNRRLRISCGFVFALASACFAMRIIVPDSEKVDKKQPIDSTSLLDHSASVSDLSFVD